MVKRLSRLHAQNAMVGLIEDEIDELTRGIDDDIRSISQSMTSLKYYHDERGSLIDVAIVAQSIGKHGHTLENKLLRRSWYKTLLRSRDKHA